MQDSQIQVITQIINMQQAIIGPLAYDLAHRVHGIQFADSVHVSGVQGDVRQVLHELVIEYSNLFGQSSIEVCKDAVRSLTPPISIEVLPDELKG